MSKCRIYVEDFDSKWQVEVTHLWRGDLCAEMRGSHLLSVTHNRSLKSKFTYNWKPSWAFARRLNFFGRYLGGGLNHFFLKGRRRWCLAVSLSLKRVCRILEIFNEKLWFEINNDGIIRWISKERDTHSKWMKISG